MESDAKAKQLFGVRIIGNDIQAKLMIPTL
jgi:hypothetical protein